MAISVADNFSYKGSKPLDARIQYSTVANMKNATTSDLYDGCLAYVTATKKNYQYDSSNTTDPTTGKWRELQTGGGGGSSTFADLDDVDLNNLQNGQVPKWNSQTEKWENGNAGGSGGGHVIEDEGVALTQRDTLNFVDFDLEDDTQNEKTVVQSHELTQEEFEEIFSSGLPGAITGFDMSNTTCEANIHSTDERIIGQWIDGKPLYQKTIRDDTPIVGSGATSTLQIPINSLNADYIVVKDFQFASDTNCTPICWNNGSQLAFINYVDSNIISITYSGGIAAARMSKGYSCTLQYTKTTDSAVASGEKIVGQWINGKLLYQKTKEYTNVSVSNSWTDLDVSFASNIDELVYADFFTTSANGTFVDKTSVKLSCQSGVLKIRSSDAGTLAKITITGRYTKL